ncbi:hypothetical protein SR98_06440, partial [Enterobacter hormaechei subsp. xiangfangensis]
MYSPLTTSSRQDFILLRLKNLNKDIKFIEKILFYSARRFPLQIKGNDSNLLIVFYVQIMP